MADTTLTHAFFYNSENGDRVYDASSFEYWLKKFFLTGVFVGDLMVSANEDMSVTIGEGYANVEGKVKFYDDPTTLAVTVANATYDRIDIVVIERNDADRDITLKVVTGGATDTPTPPSLVRENGVYQLCLAQIYVKAGVTAISQADITDTRPDPDLCGFVAGTVSEIDFSQIQAQFNSWMDNYEAEVAESFEGYKADLQDWTDVQKQMFIDFFNEMKDQLSEDAAGNLELQIQDLTRQVNYDFSGFRNTHTVFNADGSITQGMSNTLGEAFTQTTVFNEDGSITETLTAGDVTIATKTTVFNEDGSIDETIEEG